MPLDPGRTVAELRELQQLTGDDNGAQRVAWTDTWERGREWLRGKVSETGAEETIDAVRATNDGRCHVLTCRVVEVRS